MGLRNQLERRIQAKNQEILRLDNELREARSYVQGLQDALRLLPRDGDSSNLGKMLRPGSDMAKAREALLKEGKALHIDVLLKGIGKGKEHKASVAGSLGNYVRKNEIFTRPQPNTFGLKEFDIQVEEEPPDDFGIADDENNT